MMDKNEIIERLGRIAKHAVHTINEEPFIMSLDDGTAVYEAIDIVQQSQPQRTGWWVRDPKSNRWRCSECCSFALRTDYREECLSDYCSACGAYMKGEQYEQI